MSTSLDHRVAVAPDGTTGDARDDALSTVREYLERVLHRSREPLPPVGFAVDWADQPSRHSVVPGVPRVPLPRPLAEDPAAGPAPAAAAALTAASRTATTSRSQGDADAAVDLALVSDLLGCQTPVARRLELNWNEDATRKLHLPDAVWGRPTPSGGGMYPAEVYLVAHGHDGLPDGVFHHDTAHHALERVSTADRTAPLRAATGATARAFLVVTVRFWKNAFKYSSFCYHVVCQDVGCLLGSWRLLLAARGVPCHPSAWFDDAVVGDVVGVDGRTEAPFLVLPLGATAPAEPDSAMAADDAAASRPDEGSPPGAPLHLPRPAGPVARERSRRTLQFPLVVGAHAACTLTDPGPPPRRTGKRSRTAGTVPDGARLPLPPSGGGAGVVGSLRVRRSAFGLAARTRPVPLAGVADVLRAAHGVGGAPLDTLSEQGRVGVWLLNGTVEGLAPCAYRYDGESDTLVAGPDIRLEELQELYPLSNYNIGQVGALLALTVDVEDHLGLFGARGYRTACLDVGTACQATYLAAASHGIGVGAVLGVDTTEVDRMLGTPSQERTLLCLLLGTERPSAAFEQLLHVPGGAR